MLERTRIDGADRHRGQYIEPVSWDSAIAARVPGQCEVCRRWGAARLCPDCVARHAPPATRCPRCALRIGAAAAACGDCLRDPPPFEHTACATDYAFPWDRLIAAFKFRDQPELATPLAALMRTAGAALPAPQLVLPVPLSPARLAERGYNQAWELARRLGGAARHDVLLRPVETGAHQAELSRAQRLANLRAAFVVDARRRDAVEGRRIALVDDVFTTGATARAAAAALRAAGAAAVDVWVFARTPASP